MSHLDAAEKILEAAQRPMSSKELADGLAKSRLTSISGDTPWKTITARISSDIRRYGERSRFKRTFHGRFALRNWEFEPEFDVRPRTIHPLDETIKAVPLNAFLSHARRMAAGHVDPADFRVLIADAVDILRREAEERTDVVQLIPTFVVTRGESILSYKRTKRLPEARLHHARCINFGGHMQADDTPSLFWDDDYVLHQFLYRELLEELEFDLSSSELTPLGMLYLQGNEFERQHAGLTFHLQLDPSAEVQSLEPGMHTDLIFTPIKKMLEEAQELDSWSRELLNIIAEHPST